MPPTSAAQKHLFQAAEHGATFSKARQLRDNMSADTLHEFASGPVTKKSKPAAAQSLRTLKSRIARRK